MCLCCAAQLDKCSQDLGNSTKAVSSAIAQLLSEATQGNENYTGEDALLRHRPFNQTGSELTPWPPLQAWPPEMWLRP